MPLPDKVQSKVMALLDAEQQALTLMTMNQRAIGETQYAHDHNPHGDKAQALAREVARLQAMQPDNQARYRSLADQNAKVSRYLALLPAHAELDDAKPIRLKLKEGDTHSKAVARLRSEIMALLGERSRVERSSPTIAEMKAAASRFVDQLATDATPRLICEHGKGFSLAFGRGVVGEADPSPTQVLAWVDPKAVIRRLHEQIDAQPKPTNQMTFGDRKKRLNEIKDELFDLERIEQAHIEAALGDGQIIDQRPNVDIRALIGMVIVKDKVAA
jgi:hypothetical protein